MLSAKLEYMAPYKALFVAFLVVQTALSPALAAAKLSAKQQRANREAVMQASFHYIAGTASMVTSLEQFDKYFLSTLKPADRAAVLEKTKGLTKFPAVYVKNKDLVVDGGMNKLTIAWTGEGTKFLVNKAAWTFDSTKPLKGQIEALQKALDGNKSAFWFNQLVPEAEALAPLVGLLAGAAVGLLSGVVFNDLLLEAWCWTGVQTKNCIDLKRIKQGQLLENAPALDAVANQSGSDKKNILARWEFKDYSCPADNDGKDSYYRGRIRTVDLAEGKAVPKSNWFNTAAKFNPDGVPTDVIVTTGDTDVGAIDPTNPDTAKKLEVHMTFDPSTKKPISYRVPNPNYDPGSFLNNKRYITLKPGQQMTPEQVMMVASANDAVMAINYRIYNCVVQKVAADQQAGIDPGSPAQPKTGAEERATTAK